MKFFKCILKVYYFLGFYGFVFFIMKKYCLKKIFFICDDYGLEMCSWIYKNVVFFYCEKYCMLVESEKERKKDMKVYVIIFYVDFF